jgi:hypothetical protein
MHGGIDFEGERGQAVYAAHRGWAVSSYQLITERHQDTGEPIGMGGGLFVRVYFPQIKLFTGYLHLDTVAQDIPFIPADPVKTSNTRDDWRPSKLLEMPRQKLLTEAGAKWVHQGEMIGHMGISGLFYRCTESPQERPTHSWDETHLHFMVGEWPEESGKSRNLLDPFDEWDSVESGKYTNHKARGLWLAGSDGLIRLPS